MKTRSTIGILLSSLLFLTALSGCGSTGGGNTSGGSGGTGGGGGSDIPDVPPKPDYVEVTSREDLLNICNKNDKYKLMNDIDLSGYDWTPLSNFSGSLDGDGKTISGLNISSHSANVGMFSTISGTIKNLKLTNVTISCTGDAGSLGALCGTNSGTIDNVFVSGNIDAKFYDNVGGIAGYSNNTSITNCKNSATIFGYDNVGGIVGKISISSTKTFNENLNNGSINGNSYVGGVIGSFTVVGDSYSSYNGTLTNLNNEGDVSGSGDRVGGVVGNAEGSSKSSYDRAVILSSCSNKNIVNGANYTGGIIGYGSYLNEISACTNEGNVTGNNYVGGYLGYSGTRTVLKLLENNSSITGKAYLGGIAGSSGSFVNCTNNGSITSTGVLIESLISVACVGGIAGFAQNIEKCTNNVNISINTNGYYVGGIVGKMIPDSSSCGVIKSKNYGSVDSSSDYVGGIVGLIKFTSDSYNNYCVYITENDNDGVISSGGSHVGGIIGSAEGNTKSSYTHTFSFSSCNNKKSVNGTDYTGGIVGYGNYVDEISACTNLGDITGNNYVGGFAGYTGTRTTMKLLENNNTITGKAYVGGIAGCTGTLINCTNNGSIKSTGVVVESSISVACVGGIAGFAQSVEKCINNADINVSTNGNYVAGIVGKLIPSSNSAVKQCKNYGSISASGSYVAGIVGYVKITDDSYSNFSIEICDNENDGIITCIGSYVGGIVGCAEGNTKSSYTHSITIYNCNNYKNINGSNYVGGIIGYGSYVIKDTNIWMTNYNSGVISGSNSGDLYGILK